MSIANKIYDYEGYKIRYRPDSSDEKCLREILVRREYCKKSIGFDVTKGEKWLDLGANIGVFAVYCLSRGASVECYEPDKECFSLLSKNAQEAVRHNACVSHLRESQLPLWSSSRDRNYYRGTILGSVGAMKPESVQVENVWAGILGNYDGIKVDIEGAEFGILDNGLLPRCNKLCMEYHLSRDRSVKSLRMRVQYLRDTFKTVLLHSETRAIIEKGVDDKGWQDRIMWGIDRK